jgi:hypothetical protein
MEINARYENRVHENDGIVEDGTYPHLIVEVPLPGMPGHTREIAKAIMWFEIENPGLALRGGDYGPDCDHDAVLSAYAEQGINVNVR